MAEFDPDEWDNLLASNPDAHILQSTAWGKLKARFGWKVSHIILPDSGAQLLMKQVVPGIRFAYLPKGPVGRDNLELWSEIDVVCQRNHCAFLKVEPDIWMVDDQKSDLQNEQVPRNFILSKHAIQPKRTLIVDITGEEPFILSRMKQKTRYNINLARKKDVTVKPYTDLSTFYHLMEITGQRDQFGYHSLDYYQCAFDLFTAQDQCQLLVAEYENKPLAALIVFKFGKRAWYFYGASSDQYRDRMPNYLLQWEAIRWARSQGCVEYDLWGVPDEDLSTLEANFTKLNAGLWGVYRFKRGFGGELMRSIGPWDRIYKPVSYRLYSLWLKYRKAEGQ
jgi:lipid II:glycine glycyltransferase (peptidoglycan interpeptide bridge formation enzyme)